MTVTRAGGVGTRLICFRGGVDGCGALCEAVSVTAVCAETLPVINAVAKSAKPITTNESFLVIVTNLCCSSYSPALDCQSGVASRN